MHQDLPEVLEEADLQAHRQEEAIMGHRHHQEEDITEHRHHQEEGITEHRRHQEEGITEHHHRMDAEEEAEADVFHGLQV